MSQGLWRHWISTKSCLWWYHHFHEWKWPWNDHRDKNWCTEEWLIRKKHYKKGFSVPFHWLLLETLPMTMSLTIWIIVNSDAILVYYIHSVWWMNDGIVIISRQGFTNYNYFPSLPFKQNCGVLQSSSSIPAIIFFVSWNEFQWGWWRSKRCLLVWILEKEKLAKENDMKKSFLSLLQLFNHWIIEWKGGVSGSFTHSFSTEHIYSQAEGIVLKC